MGLGVLVCLRSNPGTPTQPRRPDFIGVGETTRVNTATPPNFYDFQHRTMVAPMHHRGGTVMTGNGGGNMSPQRRFLSEGELVRQSGSGAETSFSVYARAGATADNIRELAGSPQRGMYTWKDTSPGPYGGSSNGGSPVGSSAALAAMAAHQAAAAAAARGYEYIPHRPPPAHRTPSHDYHRSNPTSPTQNYSAAPRPVYYHQLPGAAQAAAAAAQAAAAAAARQYPPPPHSPQIKRKVIPTTPTTPTTSNQDHHRRPSPGSRRPMSFVRALEMSDSMELAARSPSGTPKTEHKMVVSPQDTPDRGSVYDMNYEISV